MSLKYLKELSALVEVTGSGPGFFSEAKQYSDSGEFTDEFYQLFEQVTKMKKIMKHPKWIEYMKATDRNYGTNTEGAAREAIGHIASLEDALHTIDREFDQVDNTGSKHVQDGEPDGIDTDGDEDTQ